MFFTTILVDLPVECYEMDQTDGYTRENKKINYDFIAWLLNTIMLKFTYVSVFQHVFY